MAEPADANIASASAVILCFVAGTTDVLSYLTLGQIFTSAMTGCAALFFLKATGGHYPAALRAALALASYMLGCALATLLQPREAKEVKSPRTLRNLLLVEVALLLGYCVLAALAAHPATGAARLWLIVISATAMGLQSIVAQDLSEPGISTVVLNPTMTSLGMALTKRMIGQERKLPRDNRLQIFVLIAYAAGALMTAVVIARHVTEVNWVPLVGVAVVLGLYQKVSRSTTFCEQKVAQKR